MMMKIRINIKTRSLALSMGLTLALSMASAVGASSAQAAKKVGVSFKDEIEFAEKKLLLNGLGIREATIFNVDVYVAGLYLQAKSKKAKEILVSKGPKVLHLKFVRDVDKNDIIDAWKGGFKKNCKSHCKTAKGALKELNSFMSDIKKKDELRFDFSDKGVAVWVRQKLKGLINSQEFSQILLSIFLGPSPPNSGLKSGLLGK